MISLKNNLTKFATIFKVVENMDVEDVNLEFNDKGLKVRAVHPSNHCMILFQINTTFFDNYKFENPIVYTLNITLFNKILKNAGKEIYIDAKEDYLEIKGTKSTYKLNYFVGAEDDRDLPEFETSEKWVLKTKGFFIKVKEFLEFSELVNLSGVDNGLKLATKSHMIRGNTMVDGRKIESVGIGSYFDALYIEKIKNIDDLFGDIKIGFGENTPILIKNEDDDMKFKFILACRVPEEQ